MNVGLCGLPQSGKTTLFNLLTGSHHEPHPGRVEVNIEVASVEDERLDPGDCLVRTAHGRVDAGIEVQLREIREQMVGAA